MRTRGFYSSETRPVPGTFKGGSSDFFIRKYVYDENEIDKQTFYKSDNETFFPTDFFDPCSDEKRSLIIINDFKDEFLLENIREKLRIHSLVLEDIVNTHQRNKYEKHQGEYEICMVREPWNDRQISIVILRDKVLLFQEDADESCSYFVVSRLERSEGRIRERDSGYMTFALLDNILDEYFDHTDALENEVESMEMRIEDGKDVKFSEISVLKRKIVEFRKNAVSLREMTIRMNSTEDSLLNRDPRNAPFFADLMDHATRIVEKAEKLRDISMGLVDLLDAVTSSKTNEVMKMLTIMSTIFIPITFISQVYGMNFEGIEEIHWKHGYLIFWLVAIFISLLILSYFKKKKWL